MARKRTGELAEAIQWVSNNYRLVVHELNGHVTLKWDDALTPPPSELARNYMKFASSSSTKFFADIVPKFLGEDDEVSEEDVIHDKKLIGSIRATLRKYTETGEFATRTGDGRIKENKVKKEAAALQAKAEGVEEVAPGSGPLH